MLSNPESRKKYDEYGKDWKHSEQFEQQKKQLELKAGDQSAPVGIGSDPEPP